MVGCAFRISWKIALGLCPIAALAAGLTPDSTSIEIAVPASIKSTSALAAFRLVNKSSDTVAITGIQTTCGCLTAKASREIFGPGESGVILASFEVGNKVGVYSNGITISTSVGSPVSLTVFLSSEASAALDKDVLLWAANRSEPRSVVIEAKRNLGIVLERVRVADPTAVDVVASELDSGTKYKVTFTPRSDRTQFNAVADLSVRSINGRLETYSVTLSRD